MWGNISEIYAFRSRQQSGEKGKLIVREKFNWENIVEEIEKIYLSLMR